MSLAGIPLWYDQDIILYHGTIDAHVADILNAVDVTRGVNLKDFGRGFYTTTRQDLASDWADQMAQQAGANPAVIQFQVSRNEIALLESLIFVRGDSQAIDYWSFVQYCRTIRNDHNRVFKAWYDLVAGPISGAGRNKPQSVTPTSFPSTLLMLRRYWTVAKNSGSYELPTNNC